jgi:hypothetical protein
MAGQPSASRALDVVAKIEIVAGEIRIMFEVSTRFAQAIVPALFVKWS